MLKTFLALLLVALPFKAMAATYTYQAGKGLVFAWGADDKVGITAGIVNDGSTEQKCFRTSSSQGSAPNTRSLYATGFQLKDALKYYSYYPFKLNSAFDASNIALTYTGQQQSVDGSTAHLWKYDYSASSATFTSGTFTFDYHHLGGFLRITFQVPSNVSGSATLSISTNKSSIPQSSVLNLKAQGTTAETTNSSFDNKLSISLSGLSAGSTYTAYVAMAAVDLSNEDVDISITFASGSATTLARIKGPYVRAGYLYNIDLTTVSQLKSVAKVRTIKPMDNLTAVNVNYPTAVGSDIPLDTNFTLVVEKIPQGITGDVNNDGTVNIVDVTELIKHLVNGTASSLSKTICDVNNDGQVNVTDVKGIAGLIIK